jgi:hypothetical protein
VVEPQGVGEHRYVIWSMSFEWEDYDDPLSRPTNFEKANPMGDYGTLGEAEAALAQLTIYDENWYGIPEPGSLLILWIWRETVMAERRLEVLEGDFPREPAEGFTRPHCARTPGA